MPDQVEAESKLKCVFCGYSGESASSSDKVFSCSWCQAEADNLSPEEATGLIALSEIPMGFKIWSHGRREDSFEDKGSRKAPRKEQPAQIIPELQLFIGDIDDAADLDKLKRLNVKAAVNVCSECIAKKDYWHIPGQLAEAGIDHLILCGRCTFPDNSRKRASTT